jgi:serine O-acetyltransferase
MYYDGSKVKEWAGDSTIRAIRADLARFRRNGFSGWGTEGFWALLLYRVQRSVRARRPRWLWAPARILIGIFKKLFTTITHMDIHPDAQVGPGLLIPHVGPLRIHGLTTIGADCAIHHVCTIGAGPTPGGARIGDHVLIGCHSSIIGPVTIGDRSVIAANSLVLSDVPAGSTAIGVPARIFVSMPNSAINAGKKSAAIDRA